MKKTLGILGIIAAAFMAASSATVVSASNLTGHWSDPIKSVKDGSMSMTWTCWSIEEVNQMAGEAGIPAEIWNNEAGNFIPGDLSAYGYRVIKYDENGDVWHLCKVYDILYNTARLESWVGMPLSENIDPWQKAVIGDINIDGEINAIDCLELRKYLIGQSDVSKSYTRRQINAKDSSELYYIPYSDCVTNASLYDINADGTINVIDLIRLMAQVTGQWEPVVPKSSDITHCTMCQSLRYGNPPQQNEQSGFEWVNLSEKLTAEELNELMDAVGDDWYVVDGTKPVATGNPVVEETPEKVPDENTSGAETFENANDAIVALCKSFKEANVVKTGREVDPDKPERWIEAFNQEYEIKVPTIAEDGTETYATWRMRQWADGDATVSYELQFVDGPSEYQPVGWSRFIVTMSNYDVVRSAGVESSETFETAYKAFLEALAKDEEEGTSKYYWTKYLFDMPFTMVTLESNARADISGLKQNEDGSWTVLYDQSMRFFDGTDNRMDYMGCKYGTDAMMKAFELYVNLGVAADTFVFIKDFDLVVMDGNSTLATFPMARIYG